MDIEQWRMQVLNRMLEGEMTVAEEAGLTEVSECRARRLLAAYEKDGSVPWLTETEGGSPNQPALESCLAGDKGIGVLGYSRGCPESWKAEFKNVGKTLRMQNW
jgi:hypothetical protein